MKPKEFIKILEHIKEVNNDKCKLTEVALDTYIRLLQNKLFQQERGNPVIGIITKKPYKMSYLNYSLMDKIYHKWGKKCVELNDSGVEIDYYPKQKDILKW